MPTGLESFRQKYPGSYDDMPDEQLADALYKKHYSDMPRAQFDEKMGLERWDPHREEKFDVGMGQIVPSVMRAGQALPGSVAHAGEQLWNLVTNYDKTYAKVKELGFSGVAKAIGNDLVEHYGSLEKARKTFETDPFRFLMDISAVGTGGGGLLAKLPGVAGRIGEGVAAAGRAVDPLAMAGRVSAATVREPAAGLLGRTTGTGAQTMRGAEEAGYQGTHMPAAARPWLRPGVTSTRGAMKAGAGALGIERIDALTGGHLGHMIGQHPVAAGALAASASPRLAGSAMYGLGAAQRYGEQLAPVARGAAAALPGRKEIRTKAQEALKDKQFKDRLEPEQRRVIRQVARDPKADSKAMQAARAALSGYRPLKLTVTPEEGAYGGPDAGIPSRQEGGPVTAGRAYSVGDAPGATPDTPKPETFVPDVPKGLDELWASILKGGKMPAKGAKQHAHGKKPKKAKTIHRGKVLEQGKPRT